MKSDVKVSHDSNLDSSFNMDGKFSNMTPQKQNSKLDQSDVPHRYQTLDQDNRPSITNVKNINIQEPIPFNGKPQDYGNNITSISSQSMKIGDYSPANQSSNYTPVRRNGH